MTDGSQLVSKTTVLEASGIHRAPDFRSIYANNTKFGVSAFDFSMIMGEIMESAEGDLFIEQKVKIIMSPLHAKIFASILSQNIKSFEKQFGEIRMPPSSAPAEDAAPAEDKKG